MGQSCCAQHTFDTHELDKVARNRYMRTIPNSEMERELTSLSSELLESALRKTKLRRKKLVLVTSATSPIGRSLCEEFASSSTDFIVCGIGANPKHIQQMSYEMRVVSSTIKSLSSCSVDEDDDDDSNEVEMDDEDAHSPRSVDSDSGLIGVAVPGPSTLSAYNLPHIQCVDVCSEKKMAVWIMDILEEFGIPDIVINNSTIIDGKDGVDTQGLSYEDFVTISDTNVMAYFHLLKYLIPSFIKRKKGVIINLTGTSQSVPTVFKTAYNSSKFAMEGYVESLSQQLFRAEHSSKQQMTTMDQTAAPQTQSVRIGGDFDISFITLSVGEWDMKSRRISLSTNEQTDDIKQKLLGDDAERKEHGQDEVQNGVTFQKWATNTVPLITSLMDCRGNGVSDLQRKNRYCNVDRVIDLQSMLKDKGT